MKLIIIVTLFRFRFTASNSISKGCSHFSVEKKEIVPQWLWAKYLTHAKPLKSQFSLLPAQCDPPPVSSKKAVQWALLVIRGPAAHHIHPDLQMVLPQRQSLETRSEEYSCLTNPVKWWSHHGIWLPKDSWRASQKINKFMQLLKLKAELYHSNYLYWATINVISSTCVVPAFICDYKTWMLYQDLGKRNSESKMPKWTDFWHRRRANNIYHRTQIFQNAGNQRNLWFHNKMNRLRCLRFNDYKWAVCGHGVCECAFPCQIRILL